MARLSEPNDGSEDGSSPPIRVSWPKRGKVASATDRRKASPPHGSARRWQSLFASFLRPARGVAGHRVGIPRGHEVTTLQAATR
jgi:hypothetical protein